MASFMESWKKYLKKLNKRWTFDGQNISDSQLIKMIFSRMYSRNINYGLLGPKLSRPGSCVESDLCKIVT